MGSSEPTFAIPRDLSSDVLAGRISFARGARAQPAGVGVRARRALLDTFDWRLHAAGLRLEWTTGGGVALLRLWRCDGASPPVEFTAGRAPQFAADLPLGLARRLGPLLDVRALLTQAEQRGTLDRIDLRDARDKTVARVELWSMARAPCTWVRVVPVRGFEKAARRASRSIADLPGAVACEVDPLLDAAAALPVPPGRYPSWKVGGLDPQMRADDAVQAVLRHYAHVMALNLPGTRAHLDSEFLHDFRVGLRRSRTLLGRVHGLFSPARLRRHREDLAWLGRETTVTRDADVHALVFPEYARSLSDPALTAALAPLWLRVDREREAAHARLTSVLSSARFERRWAAWNAFLAREAPRRSRQPQGPAPLESVAAHTIRRAARRVRRRGGQIGPDSPADAYHDLRKCCKDLRYLIDAFGEVVGGDVLGKATRRLKTLQDVLGEHQDLDVHRDALATLHDEMDAAGELHGESHDALQHLMDELQVRAQAARSLFAAEFRRFLDVKLERAMKRVEA